MMINAFLHPRLRENPVAATLLLMRQLRMRVDTAAVADAVLLHPDYPSLLAISDVLGRWKIRNAALRPAAEELSMLPFPALAYMNSNGGSFAVLTAVSEDKVTYMRPAGKSREITQKRDIFLREWGGVVLLAEKPVGTGSVTEKQRLLPRSAIRPLLLLLLLLMACGCIFVATPPYLLLLVVLALIKSIGCFITCLLLWYGTDKSGLALQQVCAAGKKINCDAVLQSPASRLPGGLSWSEAGYFYFAGGFLLAVLASGHEGTWPLLAWLNALALPYILFSVFYQWWVVRQWCLLCLCVQVLLAAELAVSWPAYWKPALNGASPLWNVQPQLLVMAGLLFFIPVTVWFWAKPLLVKAQLNTVLKRELFSLKYNEEVFEGQLAKQPRIIADPRQLGIILGNADAEHTIVKICNPYCSHCARAHPAINELLNENDNVRIQIIFAASGKADDPATRVVRHFLAVYLKHDEQLMRQALDDWYLSPRKHYGTFAARYPASESPAAEHAIAQMNAWCRREEITTTPAYFVNGHRLPRLYQLAELKQLLR